MQKSLKITTIGGGSSYTPELMEGIIKRAKTLPVREWWLCDIEAGREKLEIVASLARRMVKKANADIKIEHTLDRRVALDGADFVTTQIRVGQLAARALDENIPLSNGMLGQETLGAGGMFKALRTIPVILDIAKDMSELCPDAWLINFTNPAGMVTEALIKHGKISRFIGLCNVPIGLERQAAKHFDVPHEDVDMRFAGLNHLSFATKLYIKGECKTAEFLDQMGTMERFTSANIPTMQFEKGFLKTLGIIPSSYLQYYYKSGDMLQKALESYNSGENRAQIVMDLEKSLFEIYKDENLDIKPPQLEKRGGSFYSEAACRLIESIYTDKRDIQPIVTKNNGTIPFLPDDAAVEVSSIISRDVVIPLNVGRGLGAAEGLISMIKSFETLVIEAAVEKNYEKAVMALVMNPFTPSDFVARKVVDELMIAHKEYVNLT